MRPHPTWSGRDANVAMHSIATVIRLIYVKQMYCNGLRLASAAEEFHLFLDELFDCVAGGA